MTQPDDATLQALIRMAAPMPSEPMDFMTGAPKQIPVSFKAKKGGGVITYKGRF